MNYKKIIRNQNFRFFILRLFHWIPDALMLRFQYFIKLKRFLKFKASNRFTEKIQHYKIYYRNPLMLECVDKFKVRKFIETRGCTKYLNHLYVVHDTANEIAFENLPSKFVIKTTDGGGGENVYICRDKSAEIIQRIIETVNSWRNKDVSTMTREWAYNGAKSSKVIVEEYLEDTKNEDHSIDDYKFFCFDGKVEYLVVDVDRYSGHKRNFYTKKWELLDVSSDCPKADRELIKPSCFEEMVSVAEKLSDGFPFVRVDLYQIQNRIIFGEMTFYPWSGYVQFSPDSFDYELGKHFNINY